MVGRPEAYFEYIKTHFIGFNQIFIEKFIISSSAPGARESESRNIEVVDVDGSIRYNTDTCIAPARGTIIS